MRATLASGVASLVVGGLLVAVRPIEAPLGAARANAVLTIDSPMDAPRWATLERQLLSAHTPACLEFYRKYYDDQGHVQCVLRWGADDGPDDAFENFAGWPELHALGGSDEILRLYRQGLEGMIGQYTAGQDDARCPPAAEGCTTRNSARRPTGCITAKGCAVFNRMGLSVPDDPRYQARARRFAGSLHGRGSRGAQLRRAAQADPQPDQRQPRPDAAPGDADRLGGRSHRHRELHGRAQRAQLRRDARALRRIRRRRPATRS